MHISEGVLSPGILVAGAVLSAAGVAAGLRKLENEQIPSVGILSAAFFVGSLVRVPVGPASVHLTLNGLLGFLLGWKAFPAILVGLTLQALLFQFGGITTLGVNTLVMALPAVMCHYLFGWGMRSGTRPHVLPLTAFGCGFSAVLISGLLLGFSLYLTGEAFLPVAKVVVAAHLPVMVVEGVLTAACVLFLRRVKPELLEGRFEPKHA
ncbi:MAG: cobalt transporter CbiM [Thermodesulfobacteriota bacterium]|nr:cobalt transporter CbiM [Thermodesulfobacteriota bacterium]